MQSDDRFKHVSTDPKFRRLPQKERKVKIDKRFQSMFKDSKFKVKSLVDKRGRPVNFASTENYKKYYELTSSEEDSDEDDDQEEGEQKPKVHDKTSKQKKVQDEKSASSEEEDQESVDDVSGGEEADDEIDKSLNIDQDEKKLVTSEVRAKLKDLSVDYARGGGQLCTDSSSDDESSEEEDEELEHEWGELDKDAEKTDEATYRLAACNMDWDRIKSDDLMVLFHSFLPGGGTIKKVMIFPSEFGKQCMKEEEITGPKELAELTTEETGEEECNTEILRKYEMRKLKYFYAVIVCDSVATASHIYDECDGLEFESSATKLDLRFIPDDLTFDEEPRDECSKLPESGKYVPQFFTAGALTQSNFELTWDETDPRRAGINKRVWSSKDKDVDEDVLRTYVAQSSDEESDEEKPDADAYRALLEGDKKEDEGKDMEITWGVDLQNKVDEKTEEKMRKESGLGELTPFEMMMQKKKEKSKQKRLAKQGKNKDSSDNDEDDNVPFSDDDLPSDAEDIKRELMMSTESKNKKKKGKKGSKKHEEVDDKRKAELELLLMDDEGDRHFNFSSHVPKKSQTANDFEVDVKDPRFNALFTSHHYNIDPSNPSYKANKGTQALVSEKIRRRGNAEDIPQVQTLQTQSKEKKSSMGSEISNLVRNVKRKTEENQLRKSKLKKTK
ncbi:ESF1 homolog [Cloeon dipterum]|uniref:ESF1 homolog n=1 Tax=Cloeon dipterum TaxID=197152 RepID=UPI00322028E2